MIPITTRKISGKTNEICASHEILRGVFVCYMKSRSAVVIGCMLMLTVYFFCVFLGSLDLFGLILEEQSDQDLHCLFSYMRAAVVVGCFH